MSDKDDLQELKEITKDNDEAEYVAEEDHREFGTPSPLLDPYDYDEEPGTLKENARLWAKVGDAYFPADQSTFVSRNIYFTINKDFNHSAGF